MYVTIIIYLVLASILAIGTICFVTVEVIVEMAARRRAAASVTCEDVFIVPEPDPIPEPIPEPEPEPILIIEPEPEPEPVELPAPVDHIDAEEAEEMISSELAMSAARYDGGAGTGKQGIINIGDIDRAFEPYDIVTLAALKERGMISAKVGRLKVLADGILTKPLIVKSESYSIQAIKMIELTGGTVIILRD